MTVTELEPTTTTAPRTRRRVVWFASCLAALLLLAVVDLKFRPRGRPARPRVVTS